MGTRLSTLKKVLADERIKQCELSEIIGISPAHISYIIRGERTLNIDMAIKLFRATNSLTKEDYDFDYLLLKDFLDNDIETTTSKE